MKFVLLEIAEETMTYTTVLYDILSDIFSLCKAQSVKSVVGANNSFSQFELKNFADRPARTDRLRQCCRQRTFETVCGRDECVVGDIPDLRRKGNCQ